MGQRLVTTVSADGKDIATLYQHWSGYTPCALENLVTLMESYEAVKDKTAKYAETAEDTMIFATTLLNTTVGGVDLYGDCGGISRADEDEYTSRVKAINIDESDIIETTNSRNEGIIAISEEEMSDCKHWAEMSIDIDISDFGDPKFSTDAIYHISPDELVECGVRLDEIERFPMISTKIMDIMDLADIDDVKDVCEVGSGDHRYFKDDSSRTYGGVF